MSAETVTLDEVRDFLYTCLRSSERFTTTLKSTVEVLDKKSANDEWLEQAEEQLQKGHMFHEQQTELWQDLYSRMQSYIASVRKLADAVAIEGELCNSIMVLCIIVEGPTCSLLVTLHEHVKMIDLGDSSVIGAFTIHADLSLTEKESTIDKQVWPRRVNEHILRNVQCSHHLFFRTSSPTFLGLDVH